MRCKLDHASFSLFCPRPWPCTNPSVNLSNIPLLPAIPCFLVIFPFHSWPYASSIVVYGKVVAFFSALFRIAVWMEIYIYIYNIRAMGYDHCWKNLFKKGKDINLSSFKSFYILHFFHKMANYIRMKRKRTNEILFNFKSPIQSYFQKKKQSKDQKLEFTLPFHHTLSLQISNSPTSSTNLLTYYPLSSIRLRNNIPTLT